MNTTQTNQHHKNIGLILPLAFAIIGIASMATSIVLVPKLAQNLPSAKKQTPCPSCPPAAVCPQPAALPQCNPKTKPGEENLTDNANKKTAVNANDIGTGPWTINMDVDSYKIDSKGKATIEAIATMLKDNSKITLKLTGINNPKKSRKKARHAASVVKEKIAGMEKFTRRRIQIKGDQISSATGLTVIAKIVAGGDR